VLIAAIGASVLFISRTAPVGTSWSLFTVFAGMCLAAIAGLYSGTSKGLDRLWFCMILLIAGGFILIAGVILTLIAALG
jgi:hypothetical protein